jgi:hypothetical protein
MRLHRGEFRAGCTAHASVFYYLATITILVYAVQGALLWLYRPCLQPAESQDRNGKAWFIVDLEIY